MNELFIAQKAFVVQGGKLLLVRKSMDDPNQPGLWEVPGGRMRFGEEIDDQLKREVREEVGLDVIPGKPFHIWQWQLKRRDPQTGLDMDWQIVAVARLCKSTSNTLCADGRQSDDYLGEMAWVPFDQLPNYAFIPNMLPVLAAFVSEITARNE